MSRDHRDFIANQLARSHLIVTLRYLYCTIQVSNSLDPDQAWHFVRLDLGLDSKLFAKVINQPMTLACQELKISAITMEKNQLSTSAILLEIARCKDR